MSLGIVYFGVIKNLVICLLKPFMDLTIIFAELRV